MFGTFQVRSKYGRGCTVQVKHNVKATFYSIDFGIVRLMCKSQSLSTTHALFSVGII